MTVRQTICDVLQSVPNIGIVHDRERFATNLADLKLLYFSAPHNQVRGWFVRRVRVRETGILQPVYLEVVNWRIQGVMGFDDAGASELVLEQLVEAARDAFRANPSLNGTVTKIGLLPASSDRGLQQEDFGPVMFGGVLCHGVRLSLTTTTERRQ